MITLTLFLILVALASSTSFTLAGNSVSPDTAKSSASAYTFNFNTVSSFTQNFDLQIAFPNSSYAITSVANCVFSINGGVKSGAVCTADSNTNRITFTNLNIVESITSMDVQFESSTAEYAGSETIVFYYYDPGTGSQITSLINYVSVTTTNADLTITLASTSDIVGQNITYTLTYTPSVTISVDSVTQIQLQPWGAFSKSNFLTDNTTQICGGNCSLTIPADTGNVSQILRYQSLYTSQSTSTETLVMSQGRNPASTAPIDVKVTILQKISSSSFKSYMTNTITFNINTPNEFGLLNFANSDKTISQNNIITLRLSVTNPISSISYLRIDSDILSLTYQFYQYNQGTQPTETTTNDGTLLLGTLTTSTTSSPTFLTLNNFTLTNPPYANKAVSLTFTTQNLIGSTYYLIDRSTVEITASVSTITQTNIQITDTSINAATTYTVSFITINNLIKNSFIVLQFPTQVDIGSSTCSISGISSTCTINNSTHLTATLNTIILASTNITLLINNVQNPPTTTQTTSLSISTYYEDNQSIVDEVTSGITVTATSVPLQSVSLTPSSTIVRDIAEYTLEVQVDNALPSGSTMRVQLPASSHEDRTIVLNSFEVDGNAISPCTMNVLSTLYLEFDTNCFPSEVSASSFITVVLGNISNPTSTKPSQTWTVQTLYNSLQMEYLLTGITVTMVTPSDILSFSAQPASTTANQQNTFTFDFTSQYSYYSGDRVEIVFPDGVLIGAGFQCTPVTSGLTVACQTANTETLVATLTLTSTATNIQFSVSLITNNWFAGTRTFELKTTTNDTTYYYKQQGQSIVNFQAASLTATPNNDENIILLGRSTIKITLESPFTLTRASDTSLLLITVIVPAQLTPVDGTCSISYPSAACALSSQTYTITSFDDFSTSFVMTFEADATYFSQTDAFSLRLTYDGSNVATNTNMKISSYCTTPCQQCTSNQTTCLSCLPSPYTNKNVYFPDQNSCVVSCPSTYYLNSDQCSQCDQTACYECVTTSDTCISCTGSKNLHESQCLSACPSTYYALSNQCLSCVSPCFTCSSSSFCLSCITNYFLDLDNSCVVTCSDSNYMGLDGLCQQCTNNCLTCQGTLSNCTSCDESTRILLDNQCIKACPSGYYNNINTTCQLCVSPCATCISLTQCQTCVAGYYLYDGDTCTTTCPAGTIQVVDECKVCSQECATCEGVVGNCTSCVSGYYFYSNQCVTQCPQLTYPYNGECTTCIDPCVTCDNSPNLCLSCTSGLYLLNKTCLSSCPTSGYYTSGSQCIACVNNCLTCANSITCTVCNNSYYLLDGACYQTCPSSAPIVENRECKGCDEQCASCEGSADNCTECTIYYFEYTYTCVEECPFPYYSNTATYKCEDGLSTKITFFPILISGVVITLIVLISKCISKQTAAITSLVALFSYLELAVWIYVLSLLGLEYKEPDVDYTLPIIMAAVALGTLLIANIIFFIFNGRRVEDDELARQWAQNNVNYWVLKIIRILALIFHKFYRLVYGRLFNALPLSLVYQNRSNVFTIATIFSILTLVTCQIPMIIGCWYLIYNKILKDQIFYTCVQSLIVTAIAVVLTLIDIYKPDDFFEESEFLQMKRFVEKVKDSSFHKLEEKFNISQDEGSLDGERYVGLTGGKFMFSKQDPASFKDVFFEEREQSEATDAMETIEKKKTTKRINIFEPITEEDAEYYQIEKYDHQQVYTESEQIGLESQKKQKSLESDEEVDINNRNERKEEFGLDDPFDDKRSLISLRGRKKRWNNMMSKRKELADKIFNTHQLTLEKIEEPEDEDQEEEMEKGEKNRRRRRKRKGKTNKELEEIYLQRLTEKKKKGRQLWQVQKEERFDF